MQLTVFWNAKDHLCKTAANDRHAAKSYSSIKAKVFSKIITNDKVFIKNVCRLKEKPYICRQNIKLTIMNNMFFAWWWCNSRLKKS